MSYDTKTNNCYSNLNDILIVNGKITSKDLVIGIIFLSQTVIGVTGNFFLLYRYIFAFHNERKLRPTDVILKHLFVANSLVLLSKGIPRTIAAFGLKQFFNDTVCRYLSYIERVGRSVSIGTICLLSVFQNIIISPTNPCWKDVKDKAQEYICFCTFLCWILTMVVISIIPLYALHLNAEGYDNITKKINIGFCCVVDYRALMGSIYIALVVFPEVCFSLLIVWASSSMIFILHRHKQRVQHIRVTNASLRSPESRATRSILFLVSTFISFYTLSSLLRISAIIVSDLSSWLESTDEVVALCFPTTSPFLILSQHSSILMHCFSCRKKHITTLIFT
ncbi:vomeronasal type-1 receptor 4-like [Octodon degus]|uniref:Vomeronasal type-1 receptor n=1 Tax=Octodon degus TaxID=10160 RepID=A0A6P3FDX2_OCTDE|nr:vomeronasal type-1 receptor 4-like [Octodon degus]